MVKYELSDEQIALYNTAMSGKSISYTGSGGTGKSYITRVIIDSLQEKFGKSSVAVTASTGRAAFSIEGTTLHRFAGIGLGKESEAALLKRASGRASRNRWMSAKVLIIDEISMITGELFDKLEYIARSIKGNSQPFGGIQLLLVGDLLQLPPVKRDGSVLNVFQANSWSKCIISNICPKVIHRQKEVDFIRALAKIRIGVVDPEVLEFISRVSRKVEYPKGMYPVNLYGIKSKTERHNLQMIKLLDGDACVYEAVDTTTASFRHQDTVLNDCPAPKTLELKVGAQVMLVRNLTPSLVNGTVGEVIRFMTVPKNQQIPRTNSMVPIVKFILANKSVHTAPVRYETWESRQSNGVL